MIQNKIFLAFFILLISYQTSSAMLKVILDTDPSCDPDDAGCMAMLHGLASKNEIEILAIMNSFHHKESATCISAINRFYNRRAIPVGDYKYPQKVNAPAGNYDFYISHNYPHDLVSDVNAPEAFRLYREILASCPDSSVTIIVVGTMHNIELLLKSSPDDFSSLNGIDLVAQKVYQIVSMGGNFIDHVGHDRTNWGGSEALCAPERTWACLDSSRNVLTRYVIRNCPVPLIASGWENGNGEFNDAGQGNVMTGQGLKALADDHIIRRAYEHHFASRGGDKNINRHSNDQCALLYATRGAGSYYNTYLNGEITLTSNGSCLWNPDINRKAGYIEKSDINELTQVIEGLMRNPVSVADSSPPNPVTDLVVSVRQTHVVLNWHSSIDGTPGSWIAHYNVYKKNKKIGKAYGTQFFDPDMSDCNVRYQVTAVNVNGIESAKSEISVSIAEYEEKPHFVVTTKSATYYYDIEGGGFSRIIDTDGNDWISYKRHPWGEYPASAASAYRGLPNSVWQGDDDGAGHPGHAKCTSHVQGNKIFTESLSGKWVWSWTFFDDYARLEILETDPDRRYWFLYEGTPAGRFDPAGSYFGTSNGGPQAEIYDYYKNTILADTFQWMYAGYEEVDRVLYMLQLQDDELTDIISYLGNSQDGVNSRDGMTVFGFGRNVKPEPLLRGWQSFVIGFYPQKIADSSEHQKFSVFLQTRFMKEKQQP